MSITQTTATRRSKHPSWYQPGRIGQNQTAASRGCGKTEQPVHQASPWHHGPPNGNRNGKCPSFSNPLNTPLQLRFRNQGAVWPLINARSVSQSFGNTYRALVNPCARKLRPRRAFPTFLPTSSKYPSACPTPSKTGNLPVGFGRRTPPCSKPSSKPIWKPRSAIQKSQLPTSEVR